MSNLIFPIDVARYTTDTNHLTCEQDGAYWRILRKMWTEGGVIPNDERTLSRVCGLSLKRWRAICGPILAMLLVVKEGLTQKRLAADLAELTEARSRAGKASGEARRESKRGFSNRFEESPNGVSQQHVISSNQLDLLTPNEQSFRAHNAPAPAAPAYTHGSNNLPSTEITGKLESVVVLKGGMGENIKNGSVPEFSLEPSQTAKPKTPQAVLETILSEAHAKAIVDHRKIIRKPLTVHAAELLAKKFAAADTCGMTPDQAADYQIERGWQAFNPEWVTNINPAVPQRAHSPPPDEYELERRRLLSEQEPSRNARK